uniref:Uncharacterized protein n=1 Tax=Anguilla anguilla TaxID=7936 RepID=A0A0E9VTG1_ANGAN
MTLFCCSKLLDGCSIQLTLIQRKIGLSIQVSGDVQ